MIAMIDKNIFTVKIKHLLYLALLLLTIVSCSSSNKYDYYKIRATEYDFSQHEGKTVLFMSYCEGCGVAGDDLIIRFNDGSTLKVWAYKYTMEIYE